MSGVLAPGPDEVLRCWWAVGSDEAYLRYHDEEWGRPVTDDAGLFEKLVLEGFQAGLSWATILHKRERFREVLHGFDPGRVAAMGEDDVVRLLTDSGIVRHRGKIEAAINNARRALEAIAEFGALAGLVWPYAPRRTPVPRVPEDLRDTSPESVALSKELRRRGWAFVGPTTVYAFMQARGLVNDHVDGCVARNEVEALRPPVLMQYPEVGLPS